MPVEFSFPRIVLLYKSIVEPNVFIVLLKFLKRLFFIAPPVTPLNNRALVVSFEELKLHHSIITGSE